MERMDDISNSVGCTNTNDSASIASSIVSITSTENFEHEPFETFQGKVAELCKQKWPRLATDAFTITHMDGGSYNRVVAVQIDTSKKQLAWIQRHARNLVKKVCSNSGRKSQIQEYVIRMPRFEHAWVEHEIALLLFLAEKNIPVPKITSFSLSSSNPVGTPYTIQPRLHGKPVQEANSDLNIQQRISFARDLGSALAEMAKLRSSCPGSLDPTSILNGLSAPHFLRLQCPPRNAFRAGSDEPFTPATYQSVYNFLTSQLARQREYDLTLNRETINPWKPLRLITDELNKMGLFHDNAYYLTHMDFEPRNILIDTTSSTTARLSGILDWDEAVFAPAFMNCRPPSWLWDFEGDEDLDESLANVTPTDPDLHAVKKVFEDAVGPQYLAYAYSTEYRIARGICRLAITGYHSNDELDLAQDLVDEWNEMKPECRVPGLYDYEDDE
ncbi:Nn.00g053300.m01.CDS01 [Neocucurbitaria sp. VM-36]